MGRETCRPGARVNSSVKKSTKSCGKKTQLDLLESFSQLSHRLSQSSLFKKKKKKRKESEDLTCSKESDESQLLTHVRSSLSFLFFFSSQKVNSDSAGVITVKSFLINQVASSSHSFWWIF